MEYTKNLNLSKPSYDDDVDVQVLNNNMDILDDKIGTLPYTVRCYALYELPTNEL